jgi:hypothetical protein
MRRLLVPELAPEIPGGDPGGRFESALARWIEAAADPVVHAVEAVPQIGERRPLRAGRQARGGQRL